MEYSFIKKEGNGRLLLFVLGWASGPQMLEKFDIAGFDILAVYDYRDTAVPKGVAEITATYPELWLIGWSFGVYMAETLMGVLKKPVMSLAVNGTSFPCNSDYGIPPKSLRLTVRSIEKTGMDKFYERMCGGSTEGVNAADRNISEFAEELETMAATFEENENAGAMWSHALLGSGDVIFPFENMKRFWEERSPETTVTVADIPHYPFTDTGIDIIRNIIGWKEKSL